MRGSFSSLDIFKGDIVDPFASAKWMVEILEHLHAARLDINFLRADLESLHEGMRILQRDIARGKTGHRIT